MGKTENWQRVKKSIPLLILLALLFAFFIFGGGQFFSLQLLSNHYVFLTQWVGEYYLLSAFLFILLYVIIAAASLPIASFVSLVGGFLFGVFWGGIFILLGAGAGACILFLAAKSALGEMLHARLQRAEGKALSRFRKGVEENAFSFLLIMRLIPLFPFFLVNLAPAFLGVSFRVFAITTFIGILPGCFVFASIGNGLGFFLENGMELETSFWSKPQIILPLIALAVLSGLPIFYKHHKKKRGGE